MKVLLVGINSQYFHSNLAVRYLKSYTEDLDYTSKIREFTINEREEIILKEIVKEKPDVVAFSVYIWNVNITKHIANLLKLVLEDVEILFGGPEVSFDSKEFLKEVSGEYLIYGEGEKTYHEFIEYKLGCKKIEDIKGICYKKDEEVILNPPRELMDMKEVKFPYKEDEDLSNKIVYFEGSRGCPFGCIYCLSSTSHGVRFQNAYDVIKQLQYFIDKKVKLVKFVDRTFNCNHDFTMKIWKYIIEADTDTQFHFEISADLLNDKEIELLKNSPVGRIQFEVGVQTTNDEVLKNINRHVNFADIKEKVNELSSIKNIKQHLDLIAGLPGEDLSSFKKSFDDVHSIRPEEIQLGFLKVLKGSEMREKTYDYKVKYSPYPPNEVLKTKDISYLEILELKRVETVVDKYYNSQKFNNILNYFYSKFNSPYNFFLKLGDYFESKGYFNVNIGNREYYKVFLDFNKEVLADDNFELREIIKYDYLMHNKRNDLPDFLRSEISKEISDKIKEIYKGKYSFKDNKLIVFYIDIDKYINENIIIRQKTYYLISKDNSMKKVSYCV